MSFADSYRNDWTSRIGHCTSYFKANSGNGCYEAGATWKILEAGASPSQNLLWPQWGWTNSFNVIACGSLLYCHVENRLHAVFVFQFCSFYFGLWYMFLKNNACLCLFPAPPPSPFAPNQEKKKPRWLAWCVILVFFWVWIGHISSGGIRIVLQL